MLCSIFPTSRCSFARRDNEWNFTLKVDLLMKLILEFKRPPSREVDSAQVINIDRRLKFISIGSKQGAHDQEMVKYIAFFFQ